MRALSGFSAILGIVGMLAVGWIPLAEASSVTKACDSARLNGELQDLKICRDAAEGGNAAAQYFMGLMYANGDGVERDKEAGFQWLKKAALNDYPSAPFVIDALYPGRANEVKKDPLADLIPENIPAGGVVSRVARREDGGLRLIVDEEQGKQMGVELGADVEVVTREKEKPPQEPTVSETDLAVVLPEPEPVPKPEPEAEPEPETVPEVTVEKTEPEPEVDLVSPEAVAPDENEIKAYDDLPEPIVIASPPEPEVVAPPEDTVVPVAETSAASVPEESAAQEPTQDEPALIEAEQAVVPDAVEPVTDEAEPALPPAPEILVQETEPETAELPETVPDAEDIASEGQSPEEPDEVLPAPEEPDVALEETEAEPSGMTTESKADPEVIEQAAVEPADPAPEPVLSPEPALDSQPLPIKPEATDEVVEPEETAESAAELAEDAIDPQPDQAPTIELPISVTETPPETQLAEGTETVEQVLEGTGVSEPLLEAAEIEDPPAPLEPLPVAEPAPIPETVPEPEPTPAAAPEPVPTQDIALESGEDPDTPPAFEPDPVIEPVPQPDLIPLPTPDPDPVPDIALNTVDDLDAPPAGPVPPQPEVTGPPAESAPLDERRIEEPTEWDIVLASQVALKREKTVITDPNAAPEVSSVAKPSVAQQSLDAPEPEVEPISENVLVASREITPITALPYERPVRKSIQRREAAKPPAEMPTESWLIDLGSFRSPRAASRAWSTLVNRHKRDLDGLVEVLEQKGSSSLLSAGPVSSRAEADRLCNVMRWSAPDCAPRLAWASEEPTASVPPAETTDAAESWLIDLGEYGSQGAATAAWRRLRAGDSRLTDMVYFLEQAGSGSRLMAGPINDWNLVDSLCDSLRQMTHACTPRPAWQGP